MQDERMELPPPEELADWLRRTRRENGITQTDLAHRSDVSPSQISKIESQQGGTAYHTIYRIQQELLAMIESETTRPIAAVLTQKHDSHDAAYTLASVAPDASITTAVDMMQQLQISQLPVIAADGTSVGRLTERDLLDTTDSDARVKKHMRPPFPELTADTPATIARDLLETNEAILITPGNTDLEPVGEHNYVGILTPSDFTQPPTTT
jgi:predicted transcriptional regulator